MKPMRYGIIGCGMMGQEHLQNIALLDNAEVAAIFEPDAAMKQAAQKIVPGAVMKESVADLLAEPSLDCLLIASPNHVHLGQLEQIASLRPLPVLVEKPLFTAAGQVGALARLRDTYPAPVWVAMEYRYMPPVAALLRQVEEVTGGVRMLTIREHRFPFLGKVGDWNRFNRNTGGTFVEKCCHFFDLMRLIIRSEPTRIMASAGQVENHRDEMYDGERPDIWDAGYVIVDFENGARAMLELCMFAEGAEYQEEISVVGPKGKIEALVPGPGRFWPVETLGPAPVAQVVVSPRSPKGPVVTHMPVDAALLAAGDHNGSTFYQHERFLQVARGLGRPEVTVSDGWAAVAMGLAAQRSAKTGQAVRISPDWL